MTDYHPLIARAVEGLANNTGAARRTLYERARAALVAQLRGVEPALSESEITKERLALEEAIRKVEGEAARKAIKDPHPDRRAAANTEPPAPRRATAKAESRVVPRLDLSPPQEAATSRQAAETTPASLSAAATALRRGRAGLTDGAAARTDPPETAQAEPLAESRWPGKDEEEPEPAQSRLTPRLTARSRILQARTSSVLRGGIRSFRTMITEADGLGTATAKTAQSVRETRDSYVPQSRAPLLRQRSRQGNDLDGPALRQRPQRDEDRNPAALRRQRLEELPAPLALEPPFEEEQPTDLDADAAEPRALRTSYNLPTEPAPIAPRFGRPPPLPAAEHESEEEEYEEPRPRRSFRGLAKLVVLLAIVCGAAAAGWHYRTSVVGFYESVTHRTQPLPKPVAQTPPQKLPGRVPQEQIPGQATAAGSQPAAAVAQTAVLYEADPNDPQGKRYPGSVIWRTETVSPGPGLAPELAVRADISIPERHMTVTWSLRRNTDKALPASHTIEVMFNLPTDFPGGGIANVPGILMKDSEEVRGIPLAGLAVKVTNGFFLIGLNAASEDMQRNLDLLKNRSWFDILLVYNNGSRAILTIEKGPPGDRAFAEALKAWGE
jgi:hypothetical protein